MTAIQALAMVNPTHVAACVATVAGLISSSFAFDDVADEIDDTNIDDTDMETVGRTKPYITEEEIDKLFSEEEKKEEEIDQPLTEEEKCMAALSVCKLQPLECLNAFETCIKNIEKF